MDALLELARLLRDVLLGLARIGNLDILRALLETFAPFVRPVAA